MPDINLSEYGRTAAICLCAPYAMRGTELACNATRGCTGRGKARIPTRSMSREPPFIAILLPFMALFAVHGDCAAVYGGDASRSGAVAVCQYSGWHKWRRMLPCVEAVLTFMGGNGRQVQVVVAHECLNPPLIGNEATESKDGNEWG
eukprot:2527308-Rhodomonas_salina.1